MNATTLSPWLKKLPSIIYKLGSQAWIDPTYPRHLFIELTAACNLTCEYCPRERRRDHMDFGLFTALVDEASQYGPRSFSLHLFGEPTLYPRWAEAITYIKSSNRKHTILLTTNGTTLNAKVDTLIACNPDLVLWSWRPEAKFTASTKEKLRKWGRFRIRFIKEVTPKEAYLEWANWPNQEGRALHNYGGNIKLANWGSDNTVADTASSSRHPCYHLWLAPAVAWNGDILLCCADPHRKEVLGRFPEMSVHEAWTSYRLHAIRESHLRGEYGGICGGCDVWKQYPDMFFKVQKQWAKV